MWVGLDEAMMMGLVWREAGIVCIYGVPGRQAGPIVCGRAGGDVVATTLGSDAFRASYKAANGFSSSVRLESKGKRQGDNTGQKVGDI